MDKILTMGSDQNKMNVGHWLLLIVVGFLLGNLIWEAISPSPNEAVIRLSTLAVVIDLGAFHFYTVNKERDD